MNSKRKRLLIFFSLAFVIAEIAFTVLVQILSGEANRYVSYASIVLACLFLSLFAERSREYVFTQAALVMTVLADFFLVLPAEIKQFPAMVFFSVVQIAYFMRIYLATEDKRVRKIHLVTRSILTAVAVGATFAVLGRAVDAVSVVSVFYFANLLVNVIFAFAQFRKNYLLALGLLLFSFCDFLIGCSFIECYVTVTPGSLINRLANPGCNLAWIFYVPSQTLIALSLLPRRLKNSRDIEI